MFWELENGPRTVWAIGLLRISRRTSEQETLTSKSTGPGARRIIMWTIDLQRSSKRIRQRATTSFASKTCNFGAIEVWA